MRLLILAILSIGLVTQPLQARIESQSSVNTDFDASGTVDFPDFLLFVSKFGARQGDERYEARFDLDGDGEVGFGDFLLFVGSFGKAAPAPEAMGKIYWTDSGTGGDNPLQDDKIQRANLDGSEIEDIITGLQSPRGITLDVPNGKMYWADLGAGKIQRANLNGSEVEDIITGLLGPNGIALDLDGSKIYWADEFSGKIQCANLDGSNLKTLFVRYGKLIGTAINIPLGILGLKIYYANSPIGIALDISGGKIYWTIPHKYKVQRANLDGSNVEDVVTDSILTIGIALSTTP